MDSLHNLRNPFKDFPPLQVFPRYFTASPPPRSGLFFDPAPLQQDPRLRNKPVGVLLFKLSGLFVLLAETLYS